MTDQTSQKRSAGRPAKDPSKRKRNRTLSFTDAEYKRLGELAAAAGMEVSEFIIKSHGLDQEPSSRP